MTDQQLILLLCKSRLDYCEIAAERIEILAAEVAQLHEQPHGNPVDLEVLETQLTVSEAEVERMRADLAISEAKWSKDHD